jgi:hypothetical protein
MASPSETQVDEEGRLMGAELKPRHYDQVKAPSVFAVGMYLDL